VKIWDVAIIGGGIIGLSLARELRKHNMSVLVVERGEPGREASHAAAGMLADCDPMLPPTLAALASASAVLYPEFVHELADESGMRVDYRTEGCIAFLESVPDPLLPCMRPLSPQDVASLEPHLAATCPTHFLREASVDPRALVEASLHAAKHRNVDISSGSPVIEVEVNGARAVALKTSRTSFPAATIVNCSGAWAASIPPLKIPTRPVKGQMLSLVSSRRSVVKHVVRAPEVYLVPRSDGRIVIGSTLEDAGFDKRVDPDTIQRLHQAAANLVPELGEARMLEAWAGLRPGTPDALPILGATSLENYFVAAGHYRDGILLAPITAQLMSQVIRGVKPDIDLSAFSLARF